MTCREGHAARHPDFEPGNRLGLRHGAFSPAVLDEHVAEALPAFLDDNPHLDEPGFRLSVERFLRLEVRARLLHRYAAEVSADRGVDKVPARIWTEATAADNAATKLGSQLGVDPLSRARIMRETADAGKNADGLTAIAALAEQGRAARERRLPAGAPIEKEPNP